MTNQRLSLGELMEGVRNRSTAFSASNGITHAWERGFHVYGKLNLFLPLAASEDTTNAARFLRIIQSYAAIADKCAVVAGGTLLEVQGEVIHALLPGELTRDLVNRVLAFSIALANVVYDEIRPIAGDAWQSFAMSTEHGQAVLIATGNGSADSIVSLGPAANNPARQLPNTDAGHLSIRPASLALVYPIVDNRNAWEQFDLRSPPYLPSGSDVSRTFLLDESVVRAEAKRIIINSGVTQPLIRVLSESDITTQIENDVNAPFKTQGFYMRADLDGFTADVAVAFEDQSGAAVAQIVTRFDGFMAFADAFAANLNRRVIRLPWAGDCANMILLPRVGRTYRDERRFVPATEPAKWHDLTTQADGAGQQWRDILLESNWAVGVAGGDKEDEGADGYLLVANIVTSGRRFKIASGWGACRSRNALEADDVHGQDTVVHKVDYTALSESYREFFKPLNTLFYRAAGLSISKITKESVKIERQTGPAIIVGSGTALPPPKPHYTFERWN